MMRLADVNYATRVIQQIGSVAKQSTGAESETEKRAVIKVLLFSTWLHRPYFIIRMFFIIMIMTVGTFLFVLSIGKINAFESFTFTIPMFVLGLVITRLFDAQMTKATNRIVELIASHRNVRDFIISHFNVK